LDNIWTVVPGRASGPARTWSTTTISPARTAGRISRSTTSARAAANARAFAPEQLAAEQRVGQQARVGTQLAALGHRAPNRGAHARSAAPRVGAGIGR
jgi:hypothetical protein